jgi:hypothetical protein
MVSSFRIETRTYGSFSALARKPAVAVASIMSTSKSSIRPPRVYLCVLGMVW